MAKAQNPLTGQMSGSMANFVTSTRNGVNVIRSKAFNPKDANSPAQQLQRSCFKMIGEEYKMLGGITKESFPEGSPGQSAYNQFIAVNIQTVFDRSGDEPVVDYHKLLVANGTLPLVPLTEARIEAGGISIGYQTNILIPTVNADDQIVAVAQMTNGELLYAKQIRGEAKTASILLEYPGITAGMIRYCFVYTLSADCKKASQSCYVEIV